jgi:hypothetical protein
MGPGRRLDADKAQGIAPGRHLCTPKHWANREQGRLMRGSLASCHLGEASGKTEPPSSWLPEAVWLKPPDPGGSSGQVCSFHWDPSQTNLSLVWDCKRELFDGADDNDLNSQNQQKMDSLTLRFQGLC